ncbi:hypothetical protein CASFOL_029111 [Castilleja foliolosa]|uniref:Protein kinase domain-containing protein n=1 Tax=Castilleja foliolosa TaxID=1961234 RepID=A0ABD3CD12_9LAMI
MSCSDWKIQTFVFVIFLVLPLICGLTDPRDVYAINQLYANLGFPLIPGWISGPGGDPCGPPSWQGIVCVNANITDISLNGMYLRGRLNEDLGSFASIMNMDLSNNQIGGPIPTNLPITLNNFDLSNNQFGGRIPDTLSTLGQLEKLYLKNNLLAGPIPDAFVSFTRLTTMDLSGNSLTNELPSSMAGLSSLTTLRLQNNQLTGVLDVLQDLPLTDLNIENNMFSGPIPPKLLSIPDFRRGGNPFNTTVVASPPASSPPPSLTPSEAPSSQYVVPQVPVHGPPAVITVPPPQESGTSRNSRLTWIAIGALTVFIFIVFALCAFKCCRKQRTSENHTVGTHKRNKSWQTPFIQDRQDLKKVEMVPAGVRQAKIESVKKEHRIDMTGSENKDLSRGLRPLPPIRAERVVADPTLTSMTMSQNAFKIVESTKMFTIASLQQCTNSFSQENFIGKGTLGSVYRAQLPDGKVLAVKKLDNLASGHITDGEFVEMVSRISKLRHPNIVELVGYCLEHGQRLLVYNYCRNGTLDEALNIDDPINRKLSWNARIRLALQAAKALEYLHEVCKPAVMHRNLKSCNVLLEDDLSVRVSDCGLAPLLSANSMAQLQSSGYGAPELEFGSYSHQSDVYSFGVVLLRLLTGRESFDRSRPRGEQFLARWAFSRLHDIDALSRMVDPTLNGAYPSMSLSRVADIISLCIQTEPEFRPPMSEIVQKLLRIIQT